MTESEKYIIANMTPLERWIRKYRFYPALIMTAIVFAYGIAEVILTGAASTAGYLVSGWVSIVVASRLLWIQISKREVQLLAKGGFRKEIIDAADRIIN